MGISALPSLGDCRGHRPRRWRRLRDRGDRGGRSGQFCNGRQHLAPIADDRDADILQVLGRQLRHGHCWQFTDRVASLSKIFLFERGSPDGATLAATSSIW